VGSSSMPGNTARHAFIYSNGKMSDLGTLSGNPFSEAADINDSGQIVGITGPYTNTTLCVPFIYSNGTMTQLPSAVNAHAYAINNSGAVVGDDGGPILWVNGVRTSILPPTAIYGQAFDINNLGDITGQMQFTNYSEDPFLYKNVTVADLGTLISGNDVYGEGLGVNNSDQIVGSINAILANQTDFFLYTGGTMYNLRSLVDSSGSGWSFRDISAINDNGWIVGDGVGPSGNVHAFLLTPVPEPSAVILLALGGAALIAFRLRRRPTTRGPAA